MSNWLSRIGSQPQSAPAITTSLDASWLQTPSTPRSVPKPRDPNAPDYRYQVNQKCIYERRLPGGSYITAHVQRLQSGFYDSPVIHEDCIDNVRFVAINFVFHPSRSTFRFKSAEINIALHHTGEDNKNRLPIVAALAPRTSSHDHGTQTDTITRNALTGKDCLYIQGFKPSRPKFLRHAPHLLYGSISPETLNWNFNLAGSLGVSQGPASASIQPSYGVKSSYKVYDMMKIQGSVRTLRSWYGHDYDIEDGELVWTLEENSLQKSGLPREFTFVMLLSKGSGGFEESGDVRLEVEVHPKVTGLLGTSVPKLITNLHQYQPFKKGVLDLDEEIGQVFEPQVKGRGFNFAGISSNFDDFVWLPGNAYSTSEPSYSGASGAGGSVQQQQVSSQNRQASLPPQKYTSKAQQVLPAGDATLNLRVFLEPSRDSPVPLASQIQQQIPYLNLRVPPPRSRSQSPMPPSSTGSRRSGARRTVTIGSSKSVRKQRSRSELRREYSSSPEQPRAISHDPPGEVTSKHRTATAPERRPYSYQEPEDPRSRAQENGHDHATQMDPDPNHEPSPIVDDDSSSILIAPPPNPSPEYITPPAHPSQHPPTWSFQALKQDQPTRTPVPTAPPRAPPRRTKGLDVEVTPNPEGRVSFGYDNPPILTEKSTSSSPPRPRIESSPAGKATISKYSAIAAQRPSKQHSHRHSHSSSPADLAVRKREERRPASFTVTR